MHSVYLNLKIELIARRENMKPTRNLCVYCGSGPGKQPAYMAAARTLGNGNISMGVRWAIRYATERKMRPVTLTTLLRSAAVLAAEMEAKR